MNPEALIKLLNQRLDPFTKDHFHLIPSKDTALKYLINGNTSALNKRLNNPELVKVINWFEDFWLYFEIIFRQKKCTVGKKIKLQSSIYKISLSIFQGENSDQEKYQLFRAEWDDYDNPSEKHAQPHWHITSNQALERVFVNYANDFDQLKFLQMLEREKQKVLDVTKIHLAMNANWSNKGAYVNRIEDEEQLVNWLQGMLAYLRNELN